MINSHFNSNNPSYQKRKEKARGSICYLSFSWLEYIKKKRKKKKKLKLFYHPHLGGEKLKSRLVAAYYVKRCG
jgi:hypothetical protein